VIRTGVAVLLVLAVIGGLAVLSLLPDRRPVVPDATITLYDVRLTLFPEADPLAVWSFESPEARFDPAADTTVLRDLRDGRRIVGGETDFTLHGDEVTIDRNDDLIGARLSAHLVRDGWDLEMSARDGRLVRIAQREGRFEVPRAEIRGEGLDGVYEDMRITFDFTEFEAGGPGTVGYAAFEADRAPSGGER
jgi:hypothetical protein